MKLDVLFVAAHPDDVELAASGTVLSLVKQGKKVGIVDLTRGEMGTRGTPEIRKRESIQATSILGVSVRHNLDLGDGYFQNDKESQLKLISVIRAYQPEVLISNAIRDRHPDHGKGSKLATDSFFLSGLTKIETIFKGEQQDAWRPKKHFHYIQNDYIEPDFVVDVSPFWEKRMDSIYAFSSQFYNPNSTEPSTHISSKRFIDFIEARGREMGNKIGVEFAEGFTVEGTIGVSDVTNLL